MRSTSIRTLVALIAFAMAIAVGALAAGCSRTGLFGTSLDEVDANAGPPLFADGGVIPQIDITPLPDAFVPPICADASTTLIYAVTEEYSLLRFDPSTASFARIGTLDCPDPGSPFSMAVDREGIAYVLYDDEPGTHNGAFAEFGMGFSANEDDGGETLYVAGTTGELGSIDTSSYLLTDIGGFTPTFVQGELTGTGDGRLFSFYATVPQGPSSAIVQIDKTNASVIAEDVLPSVTQGGGWAFGFWGGDFYLFTAPGGAGSIVTRFRPSDGSTTQVATYPEIIVGAGVSTCAPQESPQQ
jgi:hypothetical protein